ncbi:MAG TPA: GNAT family N-acetyltransferase [Actinomycetota bacterium]|nr:GNAT family N-acetyltransferase [Actinomycetota bacterium]
MTDLEIRPFAAEDLDAVIAALPSEAPGAHRRRIEEQERGDVTWLFAWVEGRPVGFVGLTVAGDRDPDAMVESRGYALVEFLFVEESFRRRGIARALMGALEERAREAGAPGVILDTGTGPDFAPARALYAGLGYADRGGVYLGGWSDPDRAGVHEVDTLTLWLKPFA